MPMGAGYFPEDRVVVSDLGVRSGGTGDHQQADGLSHGEQGNAPIRGDRRGNDQKTCETMERTASLLPMV